MSEIFVGRQPIYNRNLGIYGYELLFRGSRENSAAMGELSQDGATSTTIINSFIEIGLEKLVGKSYAFLNLTENFLTDEEALPIKPDQVVLEVLEDIPVTLPVLKAVKRHKENGFIVALDDFLYNPSHKPIVPLVDIIKIDIQQLDRKGLLKHIKILKKFSAKLLAEKVETLEEYEFCMSLGFEYFQGYFLSRPRILKAQTLPTNRLAIMNLLAVLQNPDTETDEIEEAISFDISISYKILKLINSAFFGIGREIDSIRQAIIILGRKQLRSWASMMAMASLDNRPSEMIHIAMTRAKMCELLAEKATIPNADSYFTVGLFSALDILMEKPLAELIQPLPLNHDIVAALLKREGSMGEALNCALAFELADFDKAVFKTLEREDISVANIEAVSWANMVVESI